MTSHHPAREGIERELRSLRQAYGPLDDIKLATASFIVRALGNHDVEVAFTRLVDLATEHSDRDVDAAMASIGLGVRSEAALDRLSEYGERHLVDPRTVRRWSDAGIAKLTQLIIGSAPWIQPRARQLLDAREDGILTYRLRLAIPPRIRMNTPILRIDKQEIEIGMPEIASSEKQQDFGSPTQELGTLDDLPLRIRLSWTGEKYPVYETVTRGTPLVSFASRISFHSLITDIRRSKKPVRLDGSHA